MAFGRLIGSITLSRSCTGPRASSSIWTLNLSIILTRIATNGTTPSETFGIVAKGTRRRVGAELVVNASHLFVLF